MNNFSAVIIILIILFISCYNDPLRQVYDMASKINDLKKLEENLEKELDSKKQAARLYEKAIETLTKAVIGKAQVEKKLGKSYLDFHAFKLAKTHLENSIKYIEDDHSVYYWLGLACSNLWKISHKKTEKQEYFTHADNYYTTALKLKPEHHSSLYGISSLYIFAKPDDKNYLVKSIAHLTKLKNIRPSYKEAYFLLARAYYLNLQDGKALDIYESLKRMKLTARERDSVEQSITTIMQGTNLP